MVLNSGRARLPIAFIYAFFEYSKRWIDTLDMQNYPSAVVGMRNLKCERYPPVYVKD